MPEPDSSSREPTLLMPAWSRYAGKPVDMSSRRSIEIVRRGDGGDLIGKGASHADVDWFFHRGEYWRARIPLDGVEEICGQSCNFSKVKTRKGKNGTEVVLGKDGQPKRGISVLNHVQSRFRMRDEQPIELFPMDGGEEQSEPAHRVTDFVYSLEAVGPLGVTFNFRDGLGGNLISTHRFLSTQQMVFERMVVQNQFVTESPALPLDQAKRRTVLERSLVRAHEAGMAETYHLYRFCRTNNCTSNPFRIVDEVADYGFRQRLGSLLYRLPFHPRLYLRLRGLDSDSSYRRIVREEFEEYIQADETQKRKREFVRQQVKARRAARDAE